ncbi:hypothetical protein GCM10027612_02250 [Microbispora bryophytorum subsp. camponoti]
MVTSGTVSNVRRAPSWGLTVYRSLYPEDGQGRASEEKTARVADGGALPARFAHASRIAAPAWSDDAGRSVCASRCTRGSVMMSSQGQATVHKGRPQGLRPAFARGTRPRRPAPKQTFPIKLCLTRETGGAGPADRRTAAKPLMK